MLQERLSGSPDILGVPPENFSRGLLAVELHPDFGPKEEGKKVRDNWVVEEFDERIMVTPDKTSAYDKLICTVPGKGKVLNKLSEFWFKNTGDIVLNHMIKVPHPNVLIARQVETFPVEIIFRRYMAKSSTSTSVYTNYFGDESRGIEARKKIYGIEFPEGLQANQEFPMGTISTPTTKAASGEHDLELTDEQARELVDSKFGYGVWEKAKVAGFALFERARRYHKKKGLILADTKLEFGLDKDGNLMLIDEVFTPDSSRFWLDGTYEQRFREGKDPESFDKEILRRWLAENGFRGEKGARVPVVDPAVIDQMALVYEKPYIMITGKYLPETPTDPLALEREIQQAVNGYYGHVHLGGGLDTTPRENISSF